MARKKFPEDMYDFETWFDVIKGLVFRVRVYRRAGDWTPYELNNYDVIPSQYIDGDSFIFCKIEKAIELPDGEVLLGIRYLNNITKEPADFIEYNKLSNINLVEVDEDKLAVEEYNEL